MKQPTAKLVVLLGLLAGSCLPVVAAPRRAPDPPAPRIERASNAVYVRYRDHDGNWRWRLTYRGYGETLPTPPLFYYGYPHSGYTYGPGF